MAFALAAACSGSPEVVQSDGSGASGNRAGSDGFGGIDTGSGGRGGIHVGDGGDSSDAGSGPGTGCKTTCEVGECGPIADGCGALIELSLIHI